MITVYKMGMSYYEKNNNVDKNSGLFEFNMIKDAVEKIRTDKNVLIILNGIRDQKDNELIEEIKKHDVSIFIMTDAIALHTSLDIMNACSCVLHQAPDYKFEKITTRQQYNYVPELFYRYTRKLVRELGMRLEQYEDGKVFFGGNNTGRQDKFEKYSIMNNPLIVQSCKLDGQMDQRMDHNDYIRELSKHKYSLVICRDEYREPSWLTARFFEALAVGNLPLLDVDYDIKGRMSLKDKPERIYPKCDGEGGLKIVHAFFEENRLERLRVLRTLQFRADVRAERFAETIKEVIKQESV